MYAYLIRIKGIVQSVGFRPFIYRLFLNDFGWVRNTEEGVKIYLESYKKAEDVKELIVKNKPVNSVIDSIEINGFKIKQNAYSGFFIKESTVDKVKGNANVPPDLGICDKCAEELFDTKNRRFLHPFINCTNCGPRFSVITETPYDRKNTTMDGFVMCKQCKAEYTNPKTRRFHTETICCNDCGPKYQFIQNGQCRFKDTKAVKIAAEELEKGKVGLIKGIGGYHIIADANNMVAVQRIKKIKSREKKPFAVISRNIDLLRKNCFVNSEEEKLLESQVKPIVLLKSKNSILKEAVNGSPYLGAMLPYAPLHLLLFYFSNLEFLVATSANLSDMPLVYKDEDAYNFKGVDFILTNNRRIVRPLEDSVTQIVEKKSVIHRYARGYAPAPFYLKGIKKNILSLGADLKNNIAVSKDNGIILSQFSGNLEYLSNFEVFKMKVDDFIKFFDINVDKVICDKHINYVSRNYAYERFDNVVEVQHHKAHFASVLLEHQCKDDAIGVIMDGTGYGDDGNVWGGEFFIRQKDDFERLGHIKYMPLLFGDKSIKEPYRTAATYLCSIFNDCKMAKDIFNKHIDTINIIPKIMKNAIYTSSAGRLFDAVSAILNITIKNSFDAESAVKLQWIAMNYNQNDVLPYDINGYDIDFSKTLVYIAKNRSDLSLSRSFHNTFVEALYVNIKKISKISGIKTIALSGGVFQNEIILRKLCNKLTEDGFNVIFNNRFPINDGNIALGQLFFG